MISNTSKAVRLALLLAILLGGITKTPASDSEQKTTNKLKPMKPQSNFGIHRLSDLQNNKPTNKQESSTINMGIEAIKKSHSLEMTQLENYYMEQIARLNLLHEEKIKSSKSESNQAVKFMRLEIKDLKGKNKQKDDLIQSLETQLKSKDKEIGAQDKKIDDLAKELTESLTKNYKARELSEAPVKPTGFKFIDYLGSILVLLLIAISIYLLIEVINYTQKEDLESDPDFNPDNHKPQDDLNQVIQPAPEEQSNSQAKPPLLNLT